MAATPTGQQQQRRQRQLKLGLLEVESDEEVEGSYREARQADLDKYSKVLVRSARKTPDEGQREVPVTLPHGSRPLKSSDHETLPQ